MHAVFVSERLADNDVVLVRERAENRVAVSGRAQKTQPAVPPDDIDIARAEGGALALIAKFHAVENVDRFHARDGSHPLRNIAGKGGELTGAGASGRADVEIGAQLLVQ